MRFGLDVAQHQLPWTEIAARARFAEEAGFDGVWVFDHFKALYGDPAGPCFEAYTTLAALAAVTSTVRLGALVTGVTYRHPSLLATEAVTIDHVSGGRLELALGAAWFEAEHRELGIDFPPNGERVSRLEEAVQVIRLLMTGETVSFEGRYYRLDGARYRPPPVQRPTPPIWIGGHAEKRMLPLVGRIADAWHTYGPPDDVARRWDVVREHAERAGRDPATILRSTQLNLSQPIDAIRRDAERYAAAGIGYLTVGWPGEGQARVEEFVASVMPAFA